MVKKHCPRCTINFYIGRPFEIECGERCRCPECRLVFHHAETKENIIRCWVGEDDDHKHLVDGESVPARRRAAG